MTDAPLRAASKDEGVPAGKIAGVHAEPHASRLPVSTRFAELVGVPPSTYRRQAARATAGMPPCVAKQVTKRSGIEKRRPPSRT